MQHDHELGRALMSTIPHHLDDGEDPAKIATKLTRFTDMLQEHIRKENESIYPAADDMFTEEDQREMERLFEEAKNRFPDDFRDKHVSFARNL